MELMFILDCIVYVIIVLSVALLGLVASHYVFLSKGKQESTLKSLLMNVVLGDILMGVSVFSFNLVQGMYEGIPFNEENIGMVLVLKMLQLAAVGYALIANILLGVYFRKDLEE